MTFLEWLSENPLIVAAIVILLVYLIPKIGSMLSGGKFSVVGLFTTSDNRLSISEMQMFIWTIIIVGAYFACFVYYGFPQKVEVPTNLLVLMGFSLGSFVGAKAIATAGGENEGKIKKADKPHFDDLFTGKEGFDLGKFQMFAWTIVAVFAYIIRVVALITGEITLDHEGMPDIDGTMLGLMGLSQAGYLGKKVAMKPKQKNLE